jgi:imidazolonepropionase-like amidohydrolase
MCFGETGAGLLQPGQRADLAVVRGDPFDAAAAAAVAATMMDGNWVWQDGSLA